MTLLSEIYDVVHSNRDCCSPRATLAQNFMTNHDYNCDGQAPTANFTADIAAGNTPLIVQFTDTSTGGEITSYLWNFGDGTTSTEQNPSHIYTTLGDHTVSLTVTGPVGSDTLTRTGYIGIVTPPEAEFVADKTAGVNTLDVQFTDQSTGIILYYDWDFGDGTVASGERSVGSYEQNPMHTFAAPGSYTVKLKVTGSGTGDIDEVVKVDYIKINVDPPAANFVANKTAGGIPFTVQFTGTTVGTITDYLWDFGDGQTSTELSPSHTYTSVGVYTVSFTATGPGGSDVETKTNYITAETAPVAAFTSDKTSGDAPLTVQFTDQSTGVISTRRWNFGDGYTSTLTSPSHIYNTPGVYSVSLTVTGPGGQDVETKTNFIGVENITPIEKSIPFDSATGYVQEDDTITKIDGKVELISDNNANYLKELVSQQYMSKILGARNDYLYYGSNYGLGVVDLNADIKTYVNVYPVANEAVTDIVGKYAITRSYQNNGNTRLFDLDTNTAVLNLPMNNAQISFLTNTHLILAYGYNEWLSFYAYDLNDLASPGAVVSTAGFTVYYYSVYQYSRLVKDNYLFVYTPENIVVIDVIDPINPRICQTLTDSRLSAGTGMTAYKIDMDYIYIGFGSSVAIVDTTVPENISIVSIIDVGKVVKSIGIGGDYLYVLAEDSLILYDISIKNQPVITITYVDPFFTGSTSMAVSNNQLCIENGTTAILDISDPLNIPREIAYIPLDKPYYITTSPTTHFELLGSEIESCVVTYTQPAGTTIFSLVSFDNKVTWKKWNGSAWATHAGGLDDLQTGNTVPQIITGLTNLDVRAYQTIDFAFDLNTTVTTSTPSIDDVTITYV